MLAILKIYRPINLLLIGAAQLLCAYFLYFDANWTVLYNSGLFWLIGATLAIAAFAYLSNDYYDWDRDQINKVEKFNVRSMHPYLLIIHLLIVLSIVFMAGNQLGLQFLISFLVIMLVLWVYNYRLKDVPVLGNVLISALSFMSIYMVYWLFPQIDGLLVLHFALLAALLNFCREMTKDGEDLEGDEATGAQTVPVLLGLKATNQIIYFSLLFVISFVIISVYYQAQYFKGTLLYLYWGYYFLFVVVPLYYIAMRIRLAKQAEDYKLLSTWIKYTVFTGILSIMFF